MKTLIIYDSRGVIYYRGTGDYEIPEGLNYLEIEIPEGKILQSVNPATKEPVYTDMPASELDILQNKVTGLEEQLTEAQMALAEQFEAGIARDEEITSTQMALTELYEGLGV